MRSSFQPWYPNALEATKAFVGRRVRQNGGALEGVIRAIAMPHGGSGVPSDLFVSLDNGDSRWVESDRWTIVSERG